MQHVVSPTFVGRAAEMAVLARAFDDAARGGARAVLVAAEAGGGKSRLLREFESQLVGRAVVLTGCCVEQRAALPYAPFRPVLRALVREHGTAHVIGLLDGVGAADLAAVLPDFGEAPPASDPALARARLFEVLLRLFERLAEQQPLVLVVDDLHWADHASQDLLAFLVGNLRRAAVLLVTAHRSDALDPEHPVRPLVTGLLMRENVVELSLPRLTRREVAGQLAGILGREPDPALVVAVHERGNGIPLFTEAVVAPDGGLRAELPGSLQDLLVSAVHDLPDDTRRMLRAVAVGGERVAHPLLAAVTGADDATVAASLRPAVDAHVLVADDDGYAFRHSLLREALLGDLIAGERVELHRAYAVTLMTTPAPDDIRVPVAVALHWRAGYQPEQALRAAWEAIAKPDLLSYAEQLQMAEQVLELWDRVPDAGLLTGTDRVTVLELAVDAACWLCETERGEAHVAAALAALDETHDPERIAGLLAQRAPMRHQRQDPRRLDDLTEVLRLTTGHSPVRAEALGQLVRALVARDRHVEALPLAEELRVLAEHLGDPARRLEGVLSLALVRDEPAEVLRPLPSASEALGSGWLAALSHLELTAALLRGGAFAEAVATGRAALARTFEVGQGPYLGAAAAHGLARALISTGRWDEATEVVEEALSLMPPPHGRTRLLLCRGWLAVHRGRPAAASAVLEEIAHCPEREPFVVVESLRLRIEHHLLDGDPQRARELAAEAPDACSSAGARTRWPLLAASVRACAADAAAPGGVLARMTALVRTTERRGPVDHAYAATCAAELARAPGGDPGGWDDVATTWATLGEPHLESYALVRAAACAAGGTDRAAVAARLRRAADLATGLGAEPLLDQIAVLARRARLDIDGTRRTAADAPFRLTDREWEVLRLLAAGRSNREIGAELFISAKTTSVHVSNILAKLGVPSRLAAAATAHRLRLFDQG